MGSVPDRRLRVFGRTPVSGIVASVNVTGKTNLQLVVANGGGDNDYDHADYDHADWADAKLTCAI